MTDITRLLASLKRRSAHVKEFGDDITFVKLEDLDALVEALEKAQSKLAKIKSNSCHVDTSDGAFIPNSLDAWGRPVPQHLPYDFSGNPGASATQYCNGWNDAGGYWLNYVRELESRTVTVKLLKDHVDDADLFGWGVVVVPLEVLKEACADAGVTVEITAAGIKWEAE
ncbi:hypothetical protein SAMN03097705_3541 [[Enterobacter] aerogenes]|uniref:hypothetical protein n=1 Tax=Klebsiella aerogenes TaxID=548 RepID=UPI0009166251|nr:hypothetical protein [Klebsiella aerogenes]SFX55692.1 hypothetical protein SAMN03097705_3541 [[Enterobacter] aerogenes] [Klebsiella aerogenes]